MCKLSQRNEAAKEMQWENVKQHHSSPESGQWRHYINAILITTLLSITEMSFIYTVGCGFFLQFSLSPSSCLIFHCSLFGLHNFPDSCLSFDFPYHSKPAWLFGSSHAFSTVLSCIYQSFKLFVNMLYHAFARILLYFSMVKFLNTILKVGTICLKAEDCIKGELLQILTKGLDEYV